MLEKEMFKMFNRATSLFFLFAKFHLAYLAYGGMPGHILSKVKDANCVLDGFTWNTMILCRSIGYNYGWKNDDLGRACKTLTHISLKGGDFNKFQLNVNIEKYAFSLQNITPPNIGYVVSLVASTNYICSFSSRDIGDQSSSMSDFGVPMSTSLLGIFSDEPQSMFYYLSDTQDFDVQGLIRTNSYDDIIVRRSIFLSCSGVGFATFCCIGRSLPCGNNQLCIWGFKVSEKNNEKCKTKITGLLKNNLWVYADADVNSDGGFAFYCGVDGFQCKTLLSKASLLEQLKSIRLVYGH